MFTFLTLSGTPSPTLIANWSTGETKKEGKLNTISRAIPVTTDKKKTTLLPILTLSSFIKKKGKKDDT